MGLYSQNFLVEAQQRAPRIVPVIEGSMPDGTTWRIAHTSISSATRGAYDGVVMSMGRLFRGVDPFTNEPTAFEIKFRITDEGQPDGTNRRRFARWAATYPRKLRRSPFTLRLLLAIPGAADADRFDALPGILKNYRQTSPFEWELTIGSDDRVWDSEAGTDVPKIAFATYWASIHDDVRAFFAPEIYGEHDSNGSGNKGFVPCYLVDTVENKYVPAAGDIRAVNAVYEDDVIVSSADYTISAETKNGAVFTVIKFTGVREGVITADVEGYTAATDGSGSILLNATALQHWIVNKVYGDWRAGSAYLSATNVPVDTAYVTALDTFLGLEGHEMSLWVGGSEQRKAITVLREILDSIESKAFWTNAGKMAFGVLDFRPPADIYAVTTHLQATEDEQAEFSEDFDPTNIAKEVRVQYVLNRATGEYLQTLRLQDLSVTEDVVITRQLPCAAARVV